MRGGDIIRIIVGAIVLAAVWMAGAADTWGVPGWRIPALVIVGGFVGYWMISGLSMFHKEVPEAKLITKRREDI